MLQQTKWLLPNKQIMQKVVQMKQDPAFKHYDDAVILFLAQRDVTTADDLAEILDTNLAHAHDPALLKDSTKFVEILNKLVEQQNQQHQQPLQIVIYGDYDADGVISTYIATFCLEQLFADQVNVEHFINDRYHLGYGISVDGMKALLKQFPQTQLIITVDNGIMGFAGIDYAQKHGIHVLVTDHHEPEANGQLPAADAVVDLKRQDDSYPFKGLSGAGVIWKIMQLAAHLNHASGQVKKTINDLVDYVGISTVGDVMPLRDENRIFVKESLRRINHGRKNDLWGSRYAIRTMIETFIDNKKLRLPLDEQSFGFYLVPMINAVSRMTGSIELVFQLFNSRDVDDMRRKAAQLFQINEDRKTLTNNLLDQIDARNLVNDKHRFIVFDLDTVQTLTYQNKRISAGLIGLVAGRLEDEYHRPVIVFTHDQDGTMKGSARSIENFNMIQALRQLNQYLPGTLLQFGGHQQAAGLTIKESEFANFTKAIYSYSDQLLSATDIIPEVQVDTLINENTLSVAIARQFKQFKPFGAGFQAPHILLQKYPIFYTQAMPKAAEPQDRIHLKLIGKDTVVLYWRGTRNYRKLVQRYAQQHPDANLKKIRINAVGDIALSQFGGKNRAEFTIKDDNIRIANS